MRCKQKLFACPKSSRDSVTGQTPTNSFSTEVTRKHLGRSLNRKRYQGLRFDITSLTLPNLFGISYFFLDNSQRHVKCMFHKL